MADVTRRRIAGVPTRLWPLVLVTAAVGLAGTEAAITVAGASLTPGWLVPVFIGLFLVGEATQLHVQLRRETHSFSISEIPLVLGLYWLSPLALVISRLTAVIVVNAVRRTTPHKFVTNCTVAAAETGVAVAVFAYMSPLDTTKPLLWISVLLAVGLADLVSFAGILAAITLYEGRPAPVAVTRLVIASISVGVLNTTVGLVVLIVLKVNMLALVLLVVLAVVLVAGYRAYAQFLAQHKSLGELYAFTRAVSTARQENSLADTMLTRVRELLSAESATLWMPALGRHPETALVARVDQAGLIDEQLGEDPIRRRVLDTGVTVHLGPRGADADLRLRRALRGREVKDLIVVPLRSGTAVVGCLEVADRLHDLATFGAADVRLLETLAAHAAVAVENSRLVDRLRYDAYHDTTTGLPNRRRLVEAVEAAIAVDPVPDEVVALLEFDIDALRGVNETLGHKAGDRLLAEVGRRLRSHAPDGALVARLGGDEFAVLLRSSGVDCVVALATELRRVAIEPFPLENFTIEVGAAVGVVLFPDHGDDSESLFRRVDAATDAAKALPRGVAVYTATMESRSVHRLGLVPELRRAIEQDELTVHYQPKVALSTRELIGVECLVRWHHPDQGLLMPGEFVPVAEHTGLIGPLTRWVLRAALAECRRWQDAGRPLGVSVNLSARTLEDPDFPDDLDALLAEAGVPAGLLTLEIIEGGALTDAERPLATLRRLSDRGVRLSLDDFGVGTSSFSYLRTIPVHEIKIDRSFVLGMNTDAADLGIVRSIVGLGQHLGLSVVAEGVESERALAHLEEMGCDIAQGFLFARPLPPDRLESWVTARTSSEAAPDAGAEPGPGDTGAQDEATRRLRVVGQHG